MIRGYKNGAAKCQPGRGSLIWAPARLADNERTSTAKEAKKMRGNQVGLIVGVIVVIILVIVLLRLL